MLGWNYISDRHRLGLQAVNRAVNLHRIAMREECPGDGQYFCCVAGRQRMVCCKWGLRNTWLPSSLALSTQPPYRQGHLHHAPAPASATHLSSNQQTKHLRMLM